MADKQTKPADDDAAQPKLLGLLAQFPDADELVTGARSITDAGYRRVEAYSPFPIVAVDDALRAKKTILPWFVFFCGASGCLIATLMVWWTNATETTVPFSGYAFRISGKPYFSYQANIPIVFELTILLSAFGAFFGMLGFNRLPRLSNPLFRNERFQQVTTGGFSLMVDADDPTFDYDAVSAALTSAGATFVEPIYAETEGLRVPGALFVPGAIVAVLALIPPLWIAASASGRSELPRRTIWYDMDFQPKFKTQTVAPSSLFADTRAMRVAVPGTVSRGSLREDSEYYQGINPDTVAGVPRRGAQFASYLAEDEPASDDGNADEENAEGERADPAAQPAPEPEPNWVTEFPKEFKVSQQAAERGRERFNIHCAACHGKGGFGDGLIALRARELQQSTWVPPSNIHTDEVIQQPVGKLFATISNGIRKMPGYKEHISVEDRWAIVLYVRCLQRSQNAAKSDVPEETLKEIQQKNQPAVAAEAAADESPAKKEPPK
ncbi:hypothetical protein Pla175_50500 [Pirellulimonas nuda]|uniref:Cytochrome c domain-containing protein n=1 Tax=Pirellulimonas nuda TaxID=2528009 RepID=A0A518DJG5_9BACT|nr:quinol:electron acceptor oxidoreductase subunit ActD [Pirellulimonas nuda]QDU91620.1 hypothetical protein Pla175_50500 [Pirellulimonas nuda]